MPSPRALSHLLLPGGKERSQAGSEPNTAAASGHYRELDSRSPVPLKGQVRDLSPGHPRDEILTFPSIMSFLSDSSLFTMSSIMPPEVAYPTPLLDRP